jgi:hypothetical protein
MARSKKTVTHLSFPSIRPGYKCELRTPTGELIGEYKTKGAAYDKMRADGGKLQNFDVPFQATKHAKRAPKKFPVEKRFGFMNRLIEMVAKKITKGAVICGPAGIGKTYGVLATLERAGLEEGPDFVIIKGSISPVALYRTLFNNSNKTVIFDDCDSALFNPDSANILKAVLDTCDKRIVSWLTSASMTGSGTGGDLPPSFEFQGQILFISNLSEDKIDSAIVSRAICLDLRMDQKEIMDRIETLAPVVCADKLDPIQTTEITNWMRENLEMIFDLNLRTLIKLAQLRANSEDWEDMAVYSFTR